MQLRGLSSINYSSLSNSDVDRLYAQANANGDWSGKTAAGIEIIQRLATPEGFIFSVFGHSSFPLYQAIQLAHPNNPASFNAPQVAQTAVKTSAANVAKTIASVGSGIVEVAVGAAVIALVLFISSRRK